MVSGAFGLVVPVALCARYFLLGATSGLGGWVGWLRPSSIKFMALDMPSPAPMSTVVSVYAVALVENILLYALAGVVVWVLVRGVLRQRGPHGDCPEWL